MCGNFKRLELNMELTQYLKIKIETNSFVFTYQALMKLHIPIRPNLDR